MSSVERFRIQFDWRVTALAIVLLPLLLSLGFWQLDRAEEKRQMQSEFEQKQSSGPVAITALSRDADLRYQPVRLRGEFLNDKLLFLDNRIVQGQFGYEVVVPFRLQDESLIVLVNRGWMLGDKSRRSLPQPRLIDGVVTLSGDIYVPQGKLMQLAESAQTAWPRVEQSLDIDRLSTSFALPLFPYSVRLHSNSPAALLADWPVVNQQPEKHTGYAVQWFAMSATLLVIVLLGNTNLWALIKHRQRKA